MLVEKKIFHVGDYQTQLGEHIPNVAFGYETYGELNAKRDNAILLPHYFSGSSHAAGKYKNSDAEAGYWDALIGPGKAIDTNTFFVIGVDCLNNINGFNPNVHSTGPTTIRPSTGKPWGMAFPDLTTVDLVNVQKPLLDSLGIEKLYAAIGASGGSIQSMQWAATFPACVERVIAVVPPGIRLSEYTSAIVEMWTAPIKVDANWCDGGYYDSAFPEKGLDASLRLITINGLHYRMASKLFPIEDVKQEAGKGSRHLQSETGFMDYIHAFCDQRKVGIDPNAIIKLADTLQTFDIRDDLEKISAKMLFIVCDEDLIFQPADALASYQQLEASPVDTALVRFNSDYGHLGAILDTDKFADDIRTFLQR